MPEEPTSILIENTTTNSTVIKWSSIKANASNGILLGYKVRLEPSNQSWSYNDTETTSVTVVNLHPDTKYKVSVLGFNVNGDGGIKSKTFKTKGTGYFYTILKTSA